MGKLSELRRDSVSDLVDLSGLLHQQFNGTGEGSKELIPVRRPGQCARRGISHFLRKKIEATAVVSRKAAPAAREAERVVSHAANPVLPARVDRVRCRTWPSKHDALRSQKAAAPAEAAYAPPLRLPRTGA